MKFLFCFIFFLSGAAYCQNDPWAAYMMPSEAHKLLESYTGDFTLEMIMKMDPDQDAVRVTIPCKNTMRFGGRFLHISQKGDMMGMPFEAVTMIGYNNASGQFELTSYSTMGTGTASVAGPWTEKNKVAEMKGTMIDPVDHTPIHIRQVVSFSKDQIRIDSYDKTSNQDEMLTISYIITRDQ